MSRRSIFKTTELAEIKRQMRKGYKIKEMAKRLAPAFNVTEEKMLNKLYYISANTYMTKGRPKATKAEKNTTTTATMTNTTTIPKSAKKVEMYSDHIRIYF